MNVSKKKVLAYMLLPQVGQRLSTLGFNFTYLAFLMGQILASVRLIPKTHPYVQTNNLNRFGIRDVLAVAASRLKFNWDNSDQIIFFGLILLTIGILLLQFFAVIFFFATGTANAASDFLGFFETNPPTNDIAFMMLDKVFGVPNIFESKFSPNELGYIDPFHLGFHAMLAFYSRAMLFVGILIVLYYMFAVTIEGIQKGIPFGERFAKIYAPIRLCMAIALLIPLAYGLNLGQFTTLHIAKWGSSFATNGWKQFNSTVTNVLNASPDNLIVTPNPPNLLPTVRFYSTATACAQAYNIYYGKDIGAYLVNANMSPTSIRLTAATSILYEEALAYRGYKDVMVVYGERDSAKHAQYPGDVRPYCGAVSIATGTIERPFAVDVYRSYFELMQYLWHSEVLNTFGKKMVLVDNQTKGNPNTIPTTVAGFNWGAPTDKMPSTQYLAELLEYQQASFGALLQANMDSANLSSFYGFDYTEEDVQQGWGGAGLWYNRLANVNGAIVEAMYDLPQPSRMPEVMEFVYESKAKHMPRIAIFDKYNPLVKGGCTNVGNATVQSCITWLNGKRGIQDQYIARALYKADNFFNQDVPVTQTQSRRRQDPGPIGTMLSLIFGAEGLFDIRENEDIHPLAQMTVMGKSIMESTIRNLALGVATSTAAGAIEGAANGVGTGLQGVAGTFFTLGSITMTIGFLLYFVIPMLPFMYFFFGVGKWVMTIFEAMVAMPLWALAHLKIDGDGLTGQAASNGYFLLLEIFLRPILVIFGLIAGIGVFTASVIVMNDLWDMVSANLTGHDFSAVERGETTIADLIDIEYYREGVDVFFYTLIYVIVVYMMAMSSFKLVDQIPNSILRWINSAAKTFAEGIQDNTDQLIRYSAMGGGKLGGEMTNILKEGSFMTSNQTIGRAAAAAKKGGG